MIEIETKKMPNGKWSCFSTFQGYDHAFVSDSKEQSQQEMKDKLMKRGLLDQAIFLEAVIFPPTKHTKRYRWPFPRLDYLN